MSKILFHYWFSSSGKNLSKDDAKENQLRMDSVTTITYHQFMDCVSLRPDPEGSRCIRTICKPSFESSNDTGERANSSPGPSCSSMEITTMVHSAICNTEKGTIPQIVRLSFTSDVCNLSGLMPHNVLIYFCFYCIIVSTS